MKVEVLLEANIHVELDKNDGTSVLNAALDEMIREIPLSESDLNAIKNCDLARITIVRVHIDKSQL